MGDECNEEKRRAGKLSIRTLKTGANRRRCSATWSKPCCGDSICVYVSFGTSVTCRNCLRGGSLPGYSLGTLEPEDDRSPYASFNLSIHAAILVFEILKVTTSVLGLRADPLYSSTSTTPVAQNVHSSVRIWYGAQKILIDTNSLTMPI